MNGIRFRSFSYNLENALIYEVIKILVKAKNPAILRSPYNNAVGRFKPVLIFFLAEHTKLILGALAFELEACNYKLTYKNLHAGDMSRNATHLMRGVVKRDTPYLRIQEAANLGFSWLAASIIPMFLFVNSLKLAPFVFSFFALYVT